MSFYGSTLSAGGLLIARLFGATLLGYAVLTWFARDAGESDARWAIIVALCIYEAVGVIITVFAIVAGTLNPLAWLIVALYLFFALGFGYYLFRKG